MAPKIVLMWFWCTALRKTQAPSRKSAISTTNGEEDRTPLEDDLPILAVDGTRNEKKVYVTDVNYEEILPLKAEALMADNTPLIEE